MIVIGAGHAGIEAAHAAATLGAKTAVFTMSLDAIGNMPCNPSIGGTAKGTLVRELDALGGVMGLAADATYLQSRMLNKGKGPAVHALRVQTDRKRYHEYMKHALELTPGLAIHQAEVVGLEVENGRVKGIVTQLNGEYTAKCVVLATGTNLGGKIFVGDAWYASGPDGMHAANALTESLKAAGLPLRRFKTGTPARVHRRSIDFSRLECQPGDPDNELQPFSFMTDAPMHNKVECWIAYTNPETHKIILDNIQRSPLYGGMIEGVGPRYCPSIEDKVVRFAGKDRHPIFVEPCGENTEEMYLQGASSSLPEDVQNAFYRSIKGFEHIEILRPAYAIEYDCVDPTSLEATLESKVVRGLYGAGQFNGTSGYEEAAAQGLLAGLNAARNALGKEQLILPRHTSYLGTLVDDLVTKGVMDPYRMMTSRSEYRLTLRQDNADTRLTPIGREYGLVQDDRWAKYQHTQNILEAERRRLHDAHLRTADLQAAMTAAGLAPAAEGGIAEELLRRPEIHYDLVAGVIGWGEGITPMLAERLETEIKYAGYIARQDRMIREVARHEKTLIPEDFEYADLTGLTLEAREKLARIRPEESGPGRAHPRRVALGRGSAEHRPGGPHLIQNNRKESKPMIDKQRLEAKCSTWNICPHRHPAGPAGRLCTDFGGLQPEGQPDRHHRPRGHRGQAFPRQPALCQPAGSSRPHGGCGRWCRVSGHRHQDLQAGTGTHPHGTHRQAGGVLEVRLCPAWPDRRGVCQGARRGSRPQGVAGAV